jgi:integrase
MDGKFNLHQGHAMNTTASSKKPALASRKTIKAGAKPIKIADRDGLYLHVAVAGSKIWMLAYRFGDRQKTYKIGPYPQIDLDEARDIAHERRQLIRAGIDPRKADEQQKAKNVAAQESTLWSTCEAWLDHRHGTWATRTGERARNFLTRYVKNGLGKLPIDSVDAGMVFTLISDIAKGKTGHERRGSAPTTALSVRQMLGEVFRFAIGTGRASVNPVVMMKASDAVKKPKTRNNRALNLDQLRDVLTAVERATLSTTVRSAVRLMFLTAVRTNELIAARWTEIDLDNGLWTIPASRMKSREEHLVPLSNQAVSILRDLHKLTGKQEWVLPNARDDRRHMGNVTMNNVFVRLGFNDDSWFRGHGCRGTFSTWANENDFNRDWVEKQLAHVEKDQGRLAYNAARWLPQRKVMMQRWADTIDTLVAPQQEEQPVQSAV